MENPSIYSVFERMWQHILEKFNSYISTDVFEAHTSNIENPHCVTREQLGLDNVDNTSDADKPISTLTQAALDEKADLEHEHWSDDIVFFDPLSVECGGTGCYSIIDTEYNKPRYRASALVHDETYPDNDGIINWMYE